MKLIVKRIVALLLVCGLLFALVPNAVWATEDDPTEGYVFPDDWSREALIFAVRNGILVGDANKDLRPDSNMTRAEVAVVLNRLLCLQDRADLSAFRDVRSDAWYYDAMSAAVAAGIFYGTSATTLAPNQRITREQAMTVLCRAFGLVAKDTSLSIGFDDSAKIAAYAKNSVCAMLEWDMLSGYADNTIRPRTNITRAQVAQLLYRLIHVVSEEESFTADETKLNVYRDSTLPENFDLFGSMLVAGNVQGEWDLDQYLVSNNLIFRTAPNSTIRLTRSKTENLVCASPNSRFFAEGEFGIVSVMNHVTVDASAPRLIAENADHAVVNGNFTIANIRSGSVTLNGNYSTIQIASGAVVTLNGHADSVQLYGENITLNGSGSITKLTNYSRFPKISIAYDRFSDHMDYGLEDVKMSVSDPVTVIQEVQEVKLTATISGGIFEGAGVNDGKRKCTVTWYCNGSAVKTSTVWLTKSGAKDTYTKTYDLSKNNGKQDNYRVELTYGTSKLSAKTSVMASPYWVDYYKSLSTVKTANVPLKILYNCNMYSDRYASSVVRKLSAGDIVYNEYNPLTGMIQITYPSTGQEGWVYEDNVQFIWDNVTDSSKDYSVATKEGYINLNGYSSETKYLAWVSKYTQRVNVFEGSKGNWHLIRTILCSSGTNETPTPKGVFSIFGKVDSWWFDDYFVYNPTIFNGGHAFHSVQYTHSGYDMGNTLGIPQSHGCIRVKYADSVYLHDLPFDTTVVVY